MAHLILDIGKASPKIIDIGKADPPLDPNVVAAALGAEPTSSVFEGPLNQSPITLFQVRQALIARLESTGGQPDLSEIDRSTKDSLSDQHLQDLKQIVASLSSTGLNASPGQVASVLLTLAIDWAKKNGLPPSALANLSQT